MSSIDEKFKMVIAETAAPEAEIKEDAAVGDAAIKKGAVPPQKSDLKICHRGRWFYKGKARRSRQRWC